MDFFTSAASPAAWASVDREATGETLDQPAVLRLGTAIVGLLLADDR